MISLIIFFGMFIFSISQYGRNRSWLKLVWRIEQHIPSHWN